MFYSYSIISASDVILKSIMILLIVAFFTWAERKILGAMHRRLGPNLVGVYGILQAFADALKLLLKEIIIPALSNKVLFLASPIIVLMFSLLTIAPIVFGPGLTIADLVYGILYLLATYSLASYGIFFSGWSSNSKYAFLGSLRSTSQLISYELILTSIILMVLLFWGNFNLSVIVESQKSVWTIWPLLPAFFIFFIACIAETNRAPFDLPEAESELVSGFMTEHAGSVFVSFFLGEYASILLICIFITILFLGGYLMIFKNFFNNINPVIDGLYSCFSIGLKAIILVFIFIWVRATFPRIRFDQLMSFCWICLLPLVVAFIITIPCVLYGLEMIPNNDILFSFLLIIQYRYKLHLFRCLYFINSVIKNISEFVNTLLNNLAYTFIGYIIFLIGYIQKNSDKIIILFYIVIHIYFIFTTATNLSIFEWEYYYYSELEGYYIYNELLVSYNEAIDFSRVEMNSGNYSNYNGPNGGGSGGPSSGPNKGPDGYNESIMYSNDNKQKKEKLFASWDHTVRLPDNSEDLPQVNKLPEGYYDSTQKNRKLPSTPSDLHSYAIKQHYEARISGTPTTLSNLFNTGSHIYDLSSRQLMIKRILDNRTRFPYDYNNLLYSNDPQLSYEFISTTLKIF